MVVVTGTCQQLRVLVANGNKDWVAAKELNLSCHNMDIYLYIVNNMASGLW